MHNCNVRSCGLPAKAHIEWANGSIAHYCAKHYDFMLDKCANDMLRKINKAETRHA